MATKYLFEQLLQAHYDKDEILFYVTAICIATDIAKSGDAEMSLKLKEIVWAGKRHLKALQEKSNEQEPGQTIKTD